MTTHIADDQVHMVVVAAERGVQGARPDLCVGRERVRRAADVEVERLQAVELVLREAQHPRLAVLRRARRLDIRIIVVYKHTRQPRDGPQRTPDSPVASRIIVVPLSTMPAVVPAIAVARPYVMLWSTPQ